LYLYAFNPQQSYMSESIVQKKIARLVQRELSEIIQLGGYAPGVMPSITVVRMTPDLSLARVYVSVFPDSKLEETVALFNAEQRELRRQLAARIRNKVRKIPEIRFYVDDSFIEAEKINKLLDQLDMGKEEE